MGMKKLAQKLGLTSRHKTELSDIIYEDAQIYLKECGSSSNSPGFPHGIYDHFFLGIQSAHATFLLDDGKLYSEFSEGDTVRLGYHEVYEVTYDYVDSDFSKKQEISRKRVGNRFASLKRISDS